MLSIGIAMTLLAVIVALTAVVVFLRRPAIHDPGSLSKRWVASNRFDSQ
jgi:hypothetical protein